MPNRTHKKVEMYVWILIVAFSAEHLVPGIFFC